MSEWLPRAAVLVCAFGLFAAVAAWRLTHTVRQALAVLLDFLTAAALIRLADRPSWDTITLTAVAIVLRRIL